MYSMRLLLVFLFFFKQKTAYEMRISDWSSDVCSSDLFAAGDEGFAQRPEILLGMDQAEHRAGEDAGDQHQRDRRTPGAPGDPLRADTDDADQGDFDEQGVDREHRIKPMARQGKRSEEHPSELQSLIRISYAVFCFKNKTQSHKQHIATHKQTNTPT